MTTTKNDLLLALKSIALVQQVSHGRGAEYVSSEMARIAKDALDGKWAGIAPKVKSAAKAFQPTRRMEGRES